MPKIPINNSLHGFPNSAQFSDPSSSNKDDTHEDLDSAGVRATIVSVAQDSTDRSTSTTSRAQFTQDAASHHPLAPTPASSRQVTTVSRLDRTHTSRTSSQTPPSTVTNKEIDDPSKEPPIFVTYPNNIYLGQSVSEQVNNGPVPAGQILTGGEILAQNANWLSPDQKEKHAILHPEIVDKGLHGIEIAIANSPTNDSRLGLVYKNSYRSTNLRENRTAGNRLIADAETKRIVSMTARGQILTSFEHRNPRSYIEKNQRDDAARS